jgi:hypothetical protein
MKCKLCEEFYKKYPLVEVDDVFASGNDPKAMVHQISQYHTSSPANCYFDESKDMNWGCKTLIELRKLFDIMHEDIIRYSKEDQKTIFINIFDILDDETYPQWLVVGWYKRRGRTENIEILSMYNKSRKPTEKELVTIINQYKEIK